MAKTCERCGSKPKGLYGLLDYCAHCSRDLCEDCMEKGCCGHVPAVSGEKEDQTEEDPGIQAHMATPFAENH